LSSFLFKRYIVVAKKYNLFKGYNERSSHSGQVYTGSGILLAFVLLVANIVLDTISVFDFNSINIVITSSVLISILGFYDDFMEITAFHKYIILIFIIGMTINTGTLNDNIIINLNGFLGIYEIPYWLGLCFTGFVYLAVINAINLMDGIDTYLAIYCSLVCALLALIFLNGLYVTYSLICLLIIASLSVFVRYNISKSKKLFVGHAGSLFLGFWIAYFLVILINAPNFIGLSDQSQQILSFLPYSFFAINAENIPVLVVAIINLPVLDTLRVMLLRVLKRKSPFAADRNHIHHIFIDKGFTHLKTTLLLCMINFLNLAIIFLLEPLFNSVELTSIFILINLIWFVVFEIIKRK
jgi:UDP-N-acetylmuramyl pentapeptide phosphotransferase/UDP-N-acetylglucosamine-1-phosphate transferase